MLNAENLKGEKLIILTETEYAELLDDHGDAVLGRQAASQVGLPADMVRQVLDGTLHPLTAWRKALGLTMAELAAKAGLRVASISDIENGRIDPRYSTVRTLSDALGLAPDDIMPS